MKGILLLVTFALASKLTEGQSGDTPPTAHAICNNDHTVDIVISSVDDAEKWTAAEWRLNNSDACDPVIDNAAETVTYTNKHLPDCAYVEEQHDDYIKYIIKIMAVKPDPSGTGQLRTYDHLYYVSCHYDNQNRTMTSFVPIKNRKDNDTDDAFFTFTLMAYSDDGHSQLVPNPIELDTEIHFKAQVETQSDAPNLDLFPVLCWSSKSNDPNVDNGNFDLIKNGCGSDAVSNDLDDTLSYNCTTDNIMEKFSLKSYRYFGAEEGDKVYIHCDLRVCLADVANTKCECPADPDTCDGSEPPDFNAPLRMQPGRKRRSAADLVDESQVFHVVSGPYTFEEEEVNKDEVASEEQEETDHSFQTVAIVGAVGGVVAVAVICATVYLVMRSRNKRRQNSDLSVVT